VPPAGDHTGKCSLESVQARQLIAAGCIPVGATSVPPGTSWQTWDTPTAAPPGIRGGADHAPVSPLRAHPRRAVRRRRRQAHQRPAPSPRPRRPNPPGPLAACVSDAASRSCIPRRRLRSIRRVSRSDLGVRARRQRGRDRGGLEQLRPRLTVVPSSSAPVAAARSVVRQREAMSPNDLRPLLAPLGGAGRARNSAFLRWLAARADRAGRCAFATAPDVPLDAAATLTRAAARPSTDGDAIGT
jgi:hypothetical protein